MLLDDVLRKVVGMWRVWLWDRHLVYVVGHRKGGRVGGIATVGGWMRRGYEPPQLFHVYVAVAADIYQALLVGEVELLHETRRNELQE